MAATRVTREEMVEQSVTDYLREQIFNVRQYPAARVELVEAFTENKFGTAALVKNYLAIGFNFDDGGEPAELGSDLLRRTYGIEVWIMGRSAAEGRNLANAVRDSMETDGIVPLKDITAAGQPVIDYLMVDPVRAQREPIAQPQPWQEFLWIVTIPVIDEYHARERLMSRYFATLEADPDLARAYIAIAKRREAYLARAARPVNPTQRRADLARAAECQKVFDDLKRDFQALSRRGARMSEQLIRERVNSTQTRPQSSPRQSTRIAPAVVSAEGKGFFPGGEVNIGNIDILDARVINPRYPGDGEYWRAQEYGTTKHIGRKVMGFFEPGRSRPSGAEFRNHPYFQQASRAKSGPRAGKAPKGTPMMIIKKPIEARHFMRDGTAAFVTWHEAEATRIMNAAISRLP